MIYWPDHDEPRLPWTPPHLEIKGFMYSFKCYGAKYKRRIIYRCIHGSKNASNPCQAILKADFSPCCKNFSYKLVRNHTCASDSYSQSIGFYTDSQIKAKISKFYFDKKYNCTPEPIFNALLNWIQESTPDNETKNAISFNSVRNYVHKLVKTDPKNKISFEECLTNDKESFLLFSSRIKNKPIYGFASQFMLDHVEECQIIGIDGTFHTAPESFYQVCVFVGRTKVINLPLLYLILPNKKEETYLLSFQLYNQTLQANNIKFNENVKFICDFEIAEIKIIKNIFLRDNKYSIQLCYFHFCTNLYERKSITTSKDSKKILDGIF